MIELRACEISVWKMLSIFFVGMNNLDNIQNFAARRQRPRFFSLASSATALLKEE